ncbi:M48 family metallopeptidase [Xenophilus azovorans]|uniref:M48 family metallopeptidase n=1 Tax=Xenophilus TaxID=151754 RepID=UPI000571F651|nr:M48 family metallopeptidase [Xenophilus azovorans]
MNASLAFTLAFSAMLVLSLAVRFWLASRQIRHVARHRDAVPPPFDRSIGLAAHRRAADYTIAKARFGLLEMAWGAAVLLGWTLLGGLDLLNRLLLEGMGPGLVQQLALLAAFSLAGSLLELPFTLWQTFRLEQRFGFNRMTWKLWLADAVRGLLLGAALGLPLAALVLWLMGAAGTLWWLWAWGALVLWTALLQFIVPTWIAPLFNKFEPLADASLKERVNALMARCGFVAKGLFVMDGSRRSAHANAYFTGFGAAKRVVFFDTLLQQLAPGEVEAVLAHELGHFRHRHILKRMALMALLGLAGFALLGWVSGQVWFYTGLGVQPSMAGANDALALVLFMLAVPVFGWFVAPLMAQLSRRDEFEADAFAIAQTSGRDLSAALLKLYQDNASTLTPDPVYVRFYYSHPPASERLARMGA